MHLHSGASWFNQAYVEPALSNYICLQLGGKSLNTKSISLVCWLCPAIHWMLAWTWEAEWLPQFFLYLHMQVKTCWAGKMDEQKLTSEWWGCRCYSHGVINFSDFWWDWRLASRRHWDIKTNNNKGSSTISTAGRLLSWQCKSHCCRSRTHCGSISSEKSYCLKLQILFSVVLENQNFSWSSSLAPFLLGHKGTNRIPGYFVLPVLNLPAPILLKE